MLAKATSYLGTFALSRLRYNVFSPLRCMINILRQNRLLMNRLSHFITQSIDHFLLPFFFLKKSTFDLVFCLLQRDSA